MSFIYFILVLSITVLVHEFGHFLFAKRAGVYVYEFSIGMGPRIFKFYRKNDPTEYSIRLFPIGGFVSLAGEELEEDTKVQKDQQLCNKSWLARFLTLSAGVIFNFILAIMLLFVVGLLNGVPKEKPVIESLDENYPIINTNIEVGDQILKINRKKIHSINQVVLELTVHTGEIVTFEVKHSNGEIEKIKVKPILTERNGIESFAYGFSLDNTKSNGFLKSIRYAFIQTKNLIQEMCTIIGYLVTGKLDLSSLSGPIGIYTVVDTAAKAGFINILYLIAYLCINVGFINLIPVPAFDGGRILFLMIEKIKGSKVDPKIENKIHTIGFLLLMALMVFITYQDILRVIK